MDIGTDKIKGLRTQSGAGVMECRNALIEANGDIEKATHILKEKALFVSEKTKKRVTKQGLVEAYIHTGGRVGAIIEVNCETDFVARTDEFKKLAHELAMQVTACPSQYVCQEDIPQGSDIDAQSACLLLQPYIRDPSRTVQDLINEVISKTGENVKVSRFVRFELGEA